MGKVIQYNAKYGRWKKRYSMRKQIEEYQGKQQQAMDTIRRAAHKPDEKKSLTKESTTSP